MKAVSREVLPLLIDRQPLLLLNKTRLNVSFIDIVVHRSPSFVKTRLYGRTLPLEVWDYIITFAVGSPETDEYTLVTPCTLQQSELEESAGNPSRSVLVCDEFRPRLPYGRLRPEWFNWSASLLNDPFMVSTPGGVTHDQREMHRPILTGKVFAINANAISRQFESDTPFLFRRLRLPDVVRWLEHGVCGFCNGTRTVPRSRLRSSEMEYVFYLQNGLHPQDFPMRCTLCVGWHGAHA